VALEKTELGKLYGKFPVSVDATRNGEFQLFVDVGGTSFKAGRPFEKAKELDSVGIMRSLELAVSGITSSVQDNARQISEAEKQLAASKKKYGAPFAEEGQLNDAIAERNRLQGEMAAETAAKNTPAPAQPVQPDVQASALVGAEQDVPKLSDEQKQEFWNEAADIVRQIMPGHNPKLSVAATIKVNGKPVQGFYQASENLLGIAHNLTQSRQWVMAHETVHAMKALGLFTPGEWKLLVRDSWTHNPKMQEDVRQRWGNLSEESLQEEAVAENFGDWFDLHEMLPGWKGKLWRRVLNFIRLVARAFARITGNEKANERLDAAKILESMRVGKIGARPVGFGESPRVPLEKMSASRTLSHGELVDYLESTQREDADNGDLAEMLDEMVGDDATATLRTVPLNGLQLNGGAIDDGVVSDYAALDTQAPPIVVDGSRVIDGNHRVKAAIANGVTELPAYVIDRGSDIRASVIDTPIPSTPDPEYARRRAEAKKGIGDGPGVLENARAWWEDLTGGFTRHWRALPNVARFADVSQQFRKLEAAPHAAMTESVRYLKALVGDMNKAEYDLFGEKVLLDDLAWDAGEGRDLPFGLTPTKLAAERARVDAQFALSPKLVARLRMRKTHNAQVADAMVRAGVLTKEQIKNPAYFRHMVLDYARHEAALARTANSVKSPYWAKRMGTKLDINANLLEAELDWLQKALIDVQTAETIDHIKESGHNTRDALRDRAKADNKARLETILKNNPSARKEDGWFRSNIARGYQMVQEEIEAGHLDPIPAHLRGMADDIASGTRGESPFPLFAWMLDNDKPGAMGAGMVLKYSGLRKQWTRNLLGDAWVDADDIKGLVKHYKPEGAVAWQPKEGRHLFTAKTISESALDMFVGKLADTATPGIDREELSRALGTVRQQLVVGGDRYTMVLPEEIAATLDEFGDRRGEGMVARVFGGIQSAWKRWQLINPRRYLKYNINNTSGDLDAVIAGKPSSLLRVPEAWRMLRNASKGNVDPRYSEALERGVFTSALSAQEIPDINHLSAFRHLAEGTSSRPDKLMIAGVGKLWRALQDSTNFRESLFRLAAYLQYVEEIESGKPQLKVGYGASVPKIVDAVTDPKDRAALLSRDLLGDYGSISVAGSWLRRYLIPFWSWTEINTKRYWRLTGNAFTTSMKRGLATGGLLGGTIAYRTALTLYTRMALLYGALYLWNHLLFPDDEKDLSREQAAQLHLLLGRDADGNVISLRTQGALSDVLGELGFTDAMLALRKWGDGQGSLGSVASSMAKAPINRVATAVTPLIGEPVEQMIGQELWPDIFKPRTIHDKWRHLFQTVSAENEYDLVADKPSRGYGQSWVSGLVYKKNPDEMAYDEARTIAYDWLERTKGGSGGSSTSPRGEALRDYRLALRYGDHDAATKALARYEELGGNMKSLKQAVKRAHPLGPIAKKDRREFLNSLTDEQLDTFERAERYWQDLYEGG
jgi:hypothetical protein